MYTMIKLTNNNTKNIQKIMTTKAETKQKQTNKTHLHLDGDDNLYHWSDYSLRSFLASSTSCRSKFGSHYRYPMTQSSRKLFQKSIDFKHVLNASCTRF